MKINIGIAEKDRQEVVSILNTALADEFVLYTKTLNYHWNVTGPNFAELHKFLETQYESLEEIIDAVAERIRKIGGNASGTLKEFMAMTRLDELPGEYPDADTMLADLLSDHEAVIMHLRKDVQDCDNYSDVGTCDFLTGIMEEHEKMAWMLRSYLL